MIYQFRVASDDSLWVINTVEMIWGKASEILSAPSMSAVEAHLAKFEFSESGTLVPQGAGAYTFDGRTPKDGICTVGIMAVPFDSYLVLFLKANVPIKDETFKSNFPEEAQKFIKHRIMKPEADNTPQVKLA